MTQRPTPPRSSRAVALLHLHLLVTASAPPHPQARVVHCAFNLLRHLLAVPSPPVSRTASAASPRRRPRVPDAAVCLCFRLSATAAIPRPRRATSNQPHRAASVTCNPSAAAASPHFCQAPASPSSELRARHRLRPSTSSTIPDTCNQQPPLLVATTAATVAAAHLNAVAAAARAAATPAAPSPNACTHSRASARPSQLLPPPLPVSYTGNATRLLCPDVKFQLYKPSVKSPAITASCCPSSNRTILN